nr:hypothetical protein [uncultured Flavobacterium sp.]
MHTYKISDLKLWACHHPDKRVNPLCGDAPFNLDAVRLYAPLRRIAPILHAKKQNY